MDGAERQLEETVRMADQTIAHIQSRLADPLDRQRFATPAETLLAQVRELRRRALAELDRLRSAADRPDA